MISTRHVFAGVHAPPPRTWPRTHMAGRVTGFSGTSVAGAWVPAEGVEVTTGADVVTGIAATVTAGAMDGVTAGTSVGTIVGIEVGWGVVIAWQQQKHPTRTKMTMDARTAGRITRNHEKNVDLLYR